MKCITKAGFYLNRNKGYSFETAQRCIDFLSERGVQSFILKEQSWDFEFRDAVVLNEKDFYSEADCIITLGGDGTLLRVARKATITGVPFCGINLGKLGFLTDGSVDDAETLLTMLCEGKYQIEERRMLACRILSSKEKPKQMIGLNDVLLKSNGLRMIGIKATADQEIVDEFRADGVIVSTPTGSTAYSLAAGGPVVMPGANVMLINPICPHRLHDRTYVISPDKTISLKIQDPIGAELCIDGQIRLSVTEKDTITVTQAVERARLIRPEGFSFFERLRHKLTKEI